MIEQLFENRGPLSDFNGKILVAVAFGVITPEMGEHFQTIRHIRNAFAHSRLPITFDTPQVEREIHEFKALQAIKTTAAKQKADRPDDPHLGDFDIPNKAAYLLIVTILLIHLDDFHQQLGFDPLYGDALSEASKRKSR